LPTTTKPFNYDTDTSLIPKTTRYGVALNYGYDFYDGNVHPDIDFTWRHIHTFLQEAPAGYVDSDNANTYPGNGIPVPTTNYYNHTNQEIDIYSYRFVDEGDRSTDETTDNFRAVPSIKVKLGDDWVMNAGFNWSYSFTSDLNRGGVSISKLNAALASSNPATAYDPFSNVLGANSSAVLNSISAYDPTSNYSSMIGEDIGFTGPLVKLPAAPMEIAIGAEHRSDRFNQNFSPENNSGDILAESAIQDTAAGREVNSGYAELHIPILGKGFNLPGADQLDVWGAVRCDSYSDFGTTINPEARFRFKPVNDIVIRGSFSTGFRAPSLPELYAGGNQSFQFVNDPVTATEPEVTVNGGGNSKLHPETSENYNIGVIYTPSQVPGLTINADLWKIRYNNQIAQLDVQDLVDSNSSLVIRDNEGAISSITSPYENIANSLVQGIDMGASYVLGDPSKTWGQFTFTLNGTWLLNYLDQMAAGDPYQELAGQDSNGMGAFPRYRQTATVAWDYRSFELSVSNDFSSQVVDTNAINSNFASLAGHKIDSYSTYDLQASYAFQESQHDYISPQGGIDWMSWLDGSKITVGCDNVADFTPPLSLDPSNDPSGTDANYADYRGRFLYMAVKKTF
jgi:iron complex outermembrane receptor protein